MTAVDRGRVLLLSATLFLAYADRAVSVALAPMLGERFDLSDAELGLLNGAALIVPFALVSLVLGVTRWRFRSGRIMAGCVAVWTLAAVGFACGRTYEHLLIGRMVMGMGQAALLPAAVAALGADSASGRLSWLTTGSALGRSGGLLAVGTLLFVATSSAAAFFALPAWRVAALLMLVPNLLVAFMLMRIDEAPPGADKARPGVHDALAHMGRRIAAYAPFLTSAAAILIVVQSAGAWMPSLLVRAWGLTAAQAATAAGVVVLIGAPIGHLGAGRLSGRVSAPMLLAVSAACAVAACVLMAFAGHVVATMMGLLLLVMSGGGGAAAALIGLQALAPLPLRPATTALYLGVVTLVAYAVGPLATGLLSDAMASDADGLSKALLTVVAASGSVCALTALGGLKAWRTVARSETAS